ncbi:MAG: UDP-2,3-diacylglucosamine diphosphatase [bacterium]|nr:UDP-2,3-diacylglucosamine diphosphatase [bacterium]
MSDNTKAIFISDIHLGIDGTGEEKEREQRFIRFLKDNLNPGDRLFILGDMFDFWFEYKNAIPKDHLPVLTCLMELTQNEIAIDYIAGNHDFWVGDFFKKELGLRFHPEPVTEKIGDKTFYLLHGDGLKKNDSGYRFLKKVFRNRLNIFLYRWLHPDIGIPFAKWCSSSSRNHTSKKKYGTDEEYSEFAEKKFSEGVDYVVMGHSHKPGLQIFSDGKILMNTGDWIRNFTYGKLENGQLTLEKIDF